MAKDDKEISEKDEEEIDQIIESGKEIELPEKIKKIKKIIEEKIEEKPEVPKIEEKKEEPQPKRILTAEDILTKSEKELREQMGEDLGKRDTRNMLKELKIIMAIMLGKDRNKELSQVLDTDKSFTSKKVKELEQKGLVKKEGKGKETRYEVDQFNVLKFLQSRVVIKWSEKKKPKK